MQTNKKSFANIEKYVTIKRQWELGTKDDLVSSYPTS